MASRNRPQVCGGAGLTQLCLTNSSQGLLYVFTKQNSLINQVPLTISYHNTTMSFEEQNKI